MCPLKGRISEDIVWLLPRYLINRLMHTMLPYFAELKT